MKNSTSKNQKYIEQLEELASPSPRLIYTIEEIVDKVLEYYPEVPASFYLSEKSKERLMREISSINDFNKQIDMFGWFKNPCFCNYILSNYLYNIKSIEDLENDITFEKIFQKVFMPTILKGIKDNKINEIILDYNFAGLRENGNYSTMTLTGAIRDIKDEMKYNIRLTKDTLFETNNTNLINFSYFLYKKINKAFLENDIYNREQGFSFINFEENTLIRVANNAFAVSKDSVTKSHKDYNTIDFSKYKSYVNKDLNLYISQMPLFDLYGKDCINTKCEIRRTFEKINTAKELKAKFQIKNNLKDPILNLTDAFYTNVKVKENKLNKVKEENCIYNKNSSYIEKINNLYSFYLFDDNNKNDFLIEKLKTIIDSINKYKELDLDETKLIRILELSVPAIEKSVNNYSIIKKQKVNKENEKLLKEAKTGIETLADNVNSQINDYIQNHLQFMLIEQNAELKVLNQVLHTKSDDLEF